MIFCSSCSLNKYEGHSSEKENDSDADFFIKNDIDDNENDNDYNDYNDISFPDSVDQELDGDAQDTVDDDSTDNDFSDDDNTIDYNKDLELLDIDLKYDLKNQEPFQSAFFDGGITAYEENTDENGVPLYGEIYHPSMIAQYVINLYVDYLTDKNNDDLIEKARTSVEWLINNAVNEGNYVKWEFSTSAFLVEPPWSSALTNSWAAMALIYGAHFFPEKSDTYLKTAVKALNYMFISMHNGGALSYREDGSIWFEEYPNIETPTHVLNGFLFSLDALVIFDSLFPGTVVSEHILTAFDSLEAHVHEYDGGYGSFYDSYVKGNKLGSNYHKIHWTQIAWAYYKTKKPLFKEVSQKWFEAHFQTVSDAKASRTIDTDYHGENRLNDGTYWYQYWSSLMPVKLNIKLEKEFYVYGINIFNNDGLGLKDFTLKYLNSLGKEVVLEKNDLYYLPVGYNETSSDTKTYKTNVLPIMINEPVKTAEIIIEITSSNASDGKVVSIREIGIMKKMNDEYQSEIEIVTEKQNWQDTLNYY